MTTSFGLLAEPRKFDKRVLIEPSSKKHFMMNLKNLWAKENVINSFVYLNYFLIDKFIFLTIDNEIKMSDNF